MSDLERDLRERFRALRLPEAPTSVHISLQTTTAVPAPPRRHRRRPLLLLGLAAVLAAGALVTTGVLGPPPILVAPTPVPSARAFASPSPTPRPVASPSPRFPATVDGLPAHTVSDLLAARSAGTLPDGPIALVGYWSIMSVPHMCAPPLGGEPGELELYCSEGDFGITERDEAIRSLPDRSRHVTVASGPNLTPYVAQDLAHAIDLYGLQPVNGQVQPVPIEVVGHFDDPRAKDCRAEARQLCRERFVVDRIVNFDLAGATVPAITPSPSPFPFDSPPPIALDLAMCARQAGTDDFSFVGWMSADELAPQLASGAGFGDGEVLSVAITRAPVLVGDRGDYRVMGRSVCIAREYEPDAMQFDTIKGSVYRLYPDGRQVPTDAP